MFILIDFSIGKTEFVDCFFFVSINFGRIGDVLLNLVVRINRFMVRNQLHLNFILCITV